MKILTVLCPLKSHNPYFNRWFSAIKPIEDSNEQSVKVTILILIDGFLQSWYRFSIFFSNEGHNPYFNRWFSAIESADVLVVPVGVSQSLF